jgi:hypothetical protein
VLVGCLGHSAAETHPTQPHPAELSRQTAQAQAFFKRCQQSHRAGAVLRSRFEGSALSSTRTARWCEPVIHLNPPAPAPYVQAGHDRCTASSSIRSARPRHLARNHLLWCALVSSLCLGSIAQLGGSSRAQQAGGSDAGRLGSCHLPSCSRINVGRRGAAMAVQTSSGCAAWAKARQAVDHCAHSPESTRTCLSRTGKAPSMIRSARFRLFARHHQQWCALLMSSYCLLYSSCPLTAGSSMALAGVSPGVAAATITPAGGCTVSRRSHGLGDIVLAVWKHRLCRAEKVCELMSGLPSRELTDTCAMFRY